MALDAFGQFNDSGFDPTQNQQVQQWAAKVREQNGGIPASTASPTNPYPNQPPAPPQPGAAPQSPQTGATTAPQPPPPQPPAAAEPAPTWRNMEDSWINFAKGQGLRETRPGMFDMGGRSVQQMVDAYNKGTNQHATYVGGPSGDLVDFHDGRGPVDVKTANNEFWYSEPGQGTPGGPGGGGGGGPFIPPGEGVPGGGGAGTQTGLSNQDRYNQLYDMLMKRATQGLDVSAENPVIKAQTDAANAALERERRRNLADLAERGGANANLSAETRMTGEDVGQRTAALQSQLMGQELAAKRNEIQNALSQMGDLLTTEQKLALQRELQLYDNALRQQQLAQQQSQFESQLGFNIGDRQAYWDYMNGLGSLS